MRIVGLPAAFTQLARRRPPELSAHAHERLRLVCAWRALIEAGIGSRTAAERVGLARATLYRWYRRLLRTGARGMEDRSRTPRRRRQPTWRTMPSPWCAACGSAFPAGARTA